MDHLLWFLALCLIKFLQALPLRWVARLGRAGGALAYCVDVRHRRVAIENLNRCFASEKSPSEIRSIAREHFKRLGENYACAIKTAGMQWAQLQKHLDFAGLEKLPPNKAVGMSWVIAIGHFGNFELYARANHLFPGFQFATTYRALKQPALNKLLVELRTRSGCLVFERRQENEALRNAMNSGGLMLGFLSDQNAGTGGAWIPFFGQSCSTTIAPAVFALRYKAPLYTAICYRIGLAQWQIEAGNAIATQENGQRRSSEEIMLDVNRAFETAIRRDPANWFWVHKRWKPKQSKTRPAKAPIRQTAAMLG